MKAATEKTRHFEGVHCELSVEQPKSGVIEIRINGTDTGEFGDAPMKVLDEWLQDTRSVEFFIDARNGRGASIDVSNDWAAWLAAHRQVLSRVTMLTGNRLLQITAEFVRRFAGLNGIMWVCTEPAVYDLALAQAKTVKQD